MANEVFGINSTDDPTPDPVNAKSQISRCSRGKLNYIPAEGTTNITNFNLVYGTNYAEGMFEVVNGVLEVPIMENVTGVASGTVKNWVQVSSMQLMMKCE